MVSENDLSPRPRHNPWNKGRIIGQKRPLKPRDVWTIRVRLQLEGRKRHLALFNLAIDSKLRGCDLVRLPTDDVCVGGRVRDRATVIQKKTGRPVQFEITEQTRAAVQDWLSSLGARSCEPVRSCGLARPAAPQPAKPSSGQVAKPTLSGHSLLSMAMPARGMRSQRRQGFQFPWPYQAHTVAARNWPGVTPFSRRKTEVRWLWSANPAS